jgi:hypothetical protein
MARRQPKTLDEIVSLMLGGTYIKAKEIRRAIDGNIAIRQRMELAGEYKDRFEKFTAEANKAFKSGGDRSTFEFEGQKFQARSALRTSASVNNRTSSLGRANFKQQAYTLKKLFPELAEGQELGHKNISVLRASIAATLKVMEQDDPNRPSLKALYQIVLDIDKITEVGEDTIGTLLDKLESAVSSGLNVKASYTKDVNILTGAKGSLELEFEPRDINQFKGRLAGQVGEIFRDIILGGNKAEEFFRGIDISQIKGSPTLEEDITKQFVDFLDPKKKQKKSSSKTSSKSKGGGRKVKLKRPKKSRATLSAKIAAGTATRRTKDTGFSQVKLYAALNMKINSVVAKNMEEPGLQYQTGRFAGGVKITDVSKTPQGFASIGYTYQKYPYQTFEPGFAQGSVERDPRKLIEGSIREIAAQMVTGRLYTRRQ